MTFVAPTAPPDFGPLRRRAAIVSAIGFALFLLGALLSLQNLPAILRAYLVAWNFWVGISLGCLAVLMLQYLSGGAWGFVLRRPLESATRLLPVLAVLFLPILIGMPKLYGWVGSHDPALAEKQTYYLNVPFFVVRTVIYFAVWITISTLLNRWSDERVNGIEAGRLRQLSAGGLVLFGLTITFASVDWVMSLEPHWYSSIYGVMFAMDQILSAFAFAVMVLAVLANRPPLAGIISPEHFRALAGLLLAFVMIWAYLNFSQFLIIWSGNLLDEIPWYVRRGQGGWQWIVVLLGIGYFALPFFMLLSTDVKTSGRALIAVTALILVMRFVDLVWMIVPSADDPADPAVGGVVPHSLEAVLAFAALAGIGGIWLLLFLRHLERRPLLAANSAVIQGVPAHG